MLGPTYRALMNNYEGPQYVKKESFRTALEENHKLNPRLVMALVKGGHGLPVIEDEKLFGLIAADIERYDSAMKESYYSTLGSRYAGVAMGQIEAVRNAPAGSRPVQTFVHVRHHQEYTTRTKEAGTLWCNFKGCTKKLPYTAWNNLVAHTRKDHDGYEPDKFGTDPFGTTYNKLIEALPKTSHRKKLPRRSGV